MDDDDKSFWVEVVMRDVELDARLLFPEEDCPSSVLEADNIEEVAFDVEEAELDAALSSPEEFEPD